MWPFSRASLYRWQTWLEDLSEEAWYYTVKGVGATEVLEPFLKIKT